MARTTRLISTNDREGAYPLTREYSSGTAGNVTTAQSFVFTARNPGVLKYAVLTCGTNGVDATNPLNMTLQVKNLRTGNNMLLTGAAIDKTAGAGFQSTETNGAAGITLPVIDPANQVFSPGDSFKVTMTVVRTTPTTEFADVSFKVGYQEITDWDPVFGTPATMPPAADQS